jgi:hypothetical protein
MSYPTDTFAYYPSKRHRVRRIEIEAPAGFYAGARQNYHLLPADVVLYRADATLVDLAIEAVTHSVWIHGGMLAWDEDDGRWEILDTIAWKGGQRTPLDEAVRRNPGHWDHFRANPCNRWPEFNRSLAVAKMDEFVGRPYGWKGVFLDALSHLPLIGPQRDTKHGADDGALPFCTEATAIATRTGGADPWPHLASRFVEPVDVAQSPFFEYAGTFWPAEAF